MEDRFLTNDDKFYHLIGDFITWSTSKICIMEYIASRPRGLIDKASDFGSEDSGFKSWRGRSFFKLVFGLRRETCSAVEEI